MGITKILFVCCILILLVGCTPNNIKSKQDIELNEVNDYHILTVNNNEYRYNTNLINLLIIGVDSSDANSGGQSDFNLLVSFDRSNDNYFVLYLNRNAYIDIKEFDLEGNFLGWNKNYLALSFSYGNNLKMGTLYCGDAISKLLNNIPINYYVTIDLKDISKIQDIVGEIEVEIKDDLLASVNEAWINGSTAKINSDNVEQFIRYRDVNVDGSNEIRMMRQKEYMNSYLSKLNELLSDDFESTLNKVNALFNDIYTNVELNEINGLLEMIMNYKAGESFHELPGEVKQGLFRDQFEVDEDKLNELICELYYIK